MALINGYCTLEQLKGAIDATNGGNTTWTLQEDANLERAISAVSRWLDNYFNTSFYARTETRYYSPTFSNGDLVYVDDLLSSGKGK